MYQKDATLAALRAATRPSDELDERLFGCIHGWDYPLFGAALGDHDEHGNPAYTHDLGVTIKALAKELDAERARAIVAAAMQSEEVRAAAAVGGDWVWLTIKAALIAFLEGPEPVR